MYRLLLRPRRCHRPRARWSVCYDAPNCHILFSFFFEPPTFCVAVAKTEDASAVVAPNPVDAPNEKKLRLFVGIKSGTSQQYFPISQTLARLAALI